MHDVKQIEERCDFYKDNLAKRAFDISILDQVLELNRQRKRFTTEVETLRAKVKKSSKEIGTLKGQGSNVGPLRDEVTQAKKEIETLNTQLNETKVKQQNLLLTIPNITCEETPTGASEKDNVEFIRKGLIKKFDFTPKDHVDLGEKLGMLDFEQAAKISGARFVIYKNHLARLERALINFMLDQHNENGYTEIVPPLIVHERSLVGTGNLPKFKEDLFKIENQDWYLIPTAEVPLTNIKRDSLFDRKELPLKFCAATPCFRSEAGSHGKDTRGLIRLHQFNKVELVNIVESSKSNVAHEDMLTRAASILDALELPYRGVILCSGDIGFSARKTVDLEVWLPSQDCYREISSVSNCGDFQARRAGIRYRNADGRPEFAHTLNGSGLAIGRTLVAILENYQNEDGSITVPRVLRPYLGGLELISN